MLGIEPSGVRVWVPFYKENLEQAHAYTVAAFGKDPKLHTEMG